MTLALLSTALPARSQARVPDRATAVRVAQPIAPAIVQAFAQPSLQLQVEPDLPQVGSQVAFTATLSPPRPGILYRFNFGDDAPPSEWSLSPRTTHAYSSARRYAVVVETADAGDEFRSPLNRAEKVIEVAAAAPQPAIRPSAAPPAPSQPPAPDRAGAILVAQPMVPITGRVSERSSLQLQAEPDTPQVGSQVVFTATLAPPRPGILYRFIFGDGTPPSEWNLSQQATHAYSSARGYTAVVETADARDKLRRPLIRAERGIEVAAAAPQPTIRLSARRNRALVGDPIVFAVTTTGAGEAPGYQFNPGDGSPPETSDARTISHTYEQAKSYTASVALTSFHSPPTDSVEITIDPRVLRLHADSEVADIGQEVRFEVDRFVSNLPNLRYRFRFGDGAESGWIESPQITHAYASDRQYTVQADVASIRGDRERIIATSAPVVVTVVVPATIQLLPDRDRAFAGETITFTVRTTGTDPAPVYLFDPGDRSKPRRTNASVVQQTYETPASYIAVAELKGPRSTARDQAKITIDPLPRALLDVDPEVAQIEQSVSFGVSFSAKLSNLRYRFYLGDHPNPSDWSESPRAIHEYPAPGEYKAKAEVGRVVNRVIRPLTTTDQKPVKVLAPTIELTAGPTEVKAGETVSFTIATTGASRSARYEFDPGDGSGQRTISAPTIAYTYSKAGQYTASVVLINPQSTARDNLTLVVKARLPPWAYVVTALAAAALGIGIAGHFLIRPRLKFFLHSDAGSQSFSGHEGANITFSLHLNPNLAGIQCRIDTHGSNLIKSERKSHV